MHTLPTSSFKAFRVHTIDGAAVCKFESLTLDDLDEGDVTIRVAYSGVNYKDAMAARGIGKNVRTDRPCVTGVDLSGEVVHSVDTRFKAGDRVLVTNYKLGVSHDGGYADFARVPADWIVPIPERMTTYEAMALGSSGLTAALAVDRLEKAGLTPSSGPIAVTGATGGVGSIAIDILSKRGFEVAAISGKADQAQFLRDIGASRIISRDDFLAQDAPLAKSPDFAGALDNVGGDMLARLLARTMPHGKVAVAGMVGTALQTTVLPFVLRSVDILGINCSRQLEMSERKRIWNRLATDLKPRYLALTSRPIEFSGLDTVMDKFFKVSSVGRVLVEVTEKAPAS